MIDMFDMMMMIIMPRWTFWTLFQFVILLFSTTAKSLLHFHLIPVLRKLKGF